LKWPAKLVIFVVVVLFGIALEAAGAIQSKQLPDSSIQWPPG
jgi:hypothetical protein